MAKTSTAAQRTPGPMLDEHDTEEQGTEPTPESLITPFPEDFDFAISENLVIPVVARTDRMTQHPFVTRYPTMGHNSSFFVPTSYWLTKRGRTLDKTDFAWQRNAIGLTFTGWKHKGTPDEVAAKSKWRLVTVARELGTDPEFPQFAGVRCWKVDTSR